MSKSWIRAIVMTSVAPSAKAAAARATAEGKRSAKILCSHLKTATKEK